MKEPSIGTKLVVAAGFFTSGGALYWLVASPPSPRELLFRIGYVSAVFCAIAVLGFCWAAFVAHLALKRGWSPRTCIKAGWPFIPLALIAYVSGSQFWRVAGLLAASASFIGFLCLRLVYPHVTAEEAAGPEPPLSLFQK
jgi:hypothetical protein